MGGHTTQGTRKVGGILLGIPCRLALYWRGGICGGRKALSGGMRTPEISVSKPTNTGNPTISFATDTTVLVFVRLRHDIFGSVCTQKYSDFSNLETKRDREASLTPPGAVFAASSPLKPCALSRKGLADPPLLGRPLLLRVLFTPTNTFSLFFFSLSPRYILCVLVMREAPDTKGSQDNIIAV